MRFSKRLTEASSYAGLGLVFSGISTAIASKGGDVNGFAQIIAGIAAIVTREGDKA